MGTTALDLRMDMPSRGGGSKALSITREQSHTKGAPEVPEPLTLGAQYLTRYNTWKKFVGATTRPALVCASPKTNVRLKVSS